MIGVPMALRRATNFRKIGDAHRDAREWPAAEQAYARHLKDRPDDTDIWVQYGHVLKECGKFKEAEAAYRTAASARPDDADIYLHLGHLLKSQSRYMEALNIFEKSKDISGWPGIDEDIHQVRIKIRGLPAEDAVSDTTFYALQDLFGYLKAHPTMSGIQRVQAGIAMHLIESAVEGAEFILSDLTGSLGPAEYWRLDKSAVRNLIVYASGARVERVRLDELLSAAERTSKPVKVSGGHTIVLLGAFWGHGNTLSSFLPAKWSGARIGAYVYDLIPISHPQFCDADLTRAFSTALADLCLVADFILTISDYTRSVLSEYLEKNDGRRIPMATVPLAHSLTADGKLDGRWPAALQRVRGREYVAYVSTIEGRKNHLYVLDVWKNLIDSGVDVPDLVFVGRKGWRISGLTDLLETTNNLGGRVHIVHDLSDSELSAIYGSALFTVFTSFVEGWGLPVGESLLAGTPCVASSSSSIPEVGGVFVDYVDPYNIASGVEVVGRLLRDRDLLASRRASIASDFQPRSWPDVAIDFVEKVRLAKAEPVVPARHPQLSEGVLFTPGDIADRRVKLTNYVRSPLGLMLAQSFYQPEHWGAWMKGAYGQVAFETGLEEGTSIVVYVGISAAPWAKLASRMTIALDDSDRSALRHFALDTFKGGKAIYIRGRVGLGGLCRLTFEVEGDYKVAEGENRDFVIGLTKLGFASVKNADARISVLEAVMMTSGIATIEKGFEV